MVIGVWLWAAVRRTLTFRRALALMVAAIVGLAAWAVLMYRDLQWIQSGRVAGEAALDAARSYVPDLLSYRYTSIEADLARARGHTTGDLAVEHRKLQSVLVPEAKKTKASVRVTVAGAAVERAGPELVDVLVFINQQTEKIMEGDTRPTWQRTLNRVRVTMVKVGDRWLAANMDALLGGGPVSSQ
ncbi:hypothetical protein [Rhizohabitans arisaemae]|uniref:hypothetical protein n=1 Tax=Rhizohabitans arisaemae TaxID=2720610 RepID=UPI0024B252E4|nr:hypothetical protein [Rhizohabitans arisaemae]